MISQRLHDKIRGLVVHLQRFVDRIWYAPLLAVLAALDNFIVVVPTDGILISSSMLRPKRWMILATAVAVGSTIGAMVLAGLVDLHGLPWILKVFPEIDQSSAWNWTVEFFDRYGLIVVFVVAASPLVQQPAVILASLAHTPLTQLAAVIFVGRALKFLIMAYLGSHAPRLLTKLWGLKGEMRDAGVDLR